MDPKDCRADHRRAGLSLLEVVVYTSLVAIVGAPLLSVVLVASRGAADQGVANHTAERSRSVLYRMTQDLRNAMRDTITLAGGGSLLTFTLPASYDGTDVVPGPTVQYEFQLAVDEQGNGVDDNGNGLVDEGQLRFRNLTTGETFIVVGDLDLAGSSFTWNNTVVTVNISTAGILRVSQSVFSRDRSLSVAPRN